MKHLATFRLVSPHLTGVEGEHSGSFSKALARHERLIEEQRLRTRLDAFAQQMRDPAEQELRAARCAEREATSDKFTQAVRASELKIFREGKGAGRRCRRCFLLNSATTAACHYCGGPSDLVPFTVDADYINTSKDRLRSSFEASRARGYFTSLTLDGLQEYLQEIQATDSASPA